MSEERREEMNVSVSMLNCVEDEVRKKCNAYTIFNYNNKTLSLSVCTQKCKLPAALTVLAVPFIARTL